MDEFNNALPSTYLKWKRFIIPGDGGGIRGIAFDKTEYQYLNAAFALIVTGICAYAWRITVFLVITYYPMEYSPKKDAPSSSGGTLSEEEALALRKQKTNRYIALITILNTADPLEVAIRLASHAFKMFFRAAEPATGWYDIVVMILGLLAWAGALAAGVLIPAKLLEHGNLAPVNPASIFLAVPVIGQDTLFPRIQQTLSPSFQRALGIVEFSREELTKSVKIAHEQEGQTGPNGEKPGQITYDYNITGVEFGLQHKNAVNFVLRVNGACALEYGWFNTSISNTSTDIYNIFGQNVYVSRLDVNKPTGGQAALNYTGAVLANNSYAVIPETAGRRSYTEGTDPWYSTVKAGSGDIVVDNRRPVLSCWENNAWSYGVHNAETIDNLDSLPGLNLSHMINDILGNRLGYPMMVDVVYGLGNSFLVSSTTGFGGTLDASTATYTADFDRLILTSYVATRNIFRDTTMITQKYDLPNAALRYNITKDSPSYFVLASGDVNSLSFDTLVAIPVIFVFLYLTGFIIGHIWNTSDADHANHHDDYHNSNGNSPAELFSDSRNPIGHRFKMTSRAVAFQPTQLYKFMDESICKNRGDWVETGEMLYVKAPVRKADGGTDGENIKNVEKEGTPEYSYIAPVIECTEEEQRLAFVGLPASRLANATAPKPGDNMPGGSGIPPMSERSDKKQTDSEVIAPLESTRGYSP